MNTANFEARKMNRAVALVARAHAAYRTMAETLIGAPVDVASPARIAAARRTAKLANAAWVVISCMSSDHDSDDCARRLDWEARHAIGMKDDADAYLARWGA